MIGDLVSAPVDQHPDLLPEPVRAALALPAVADLAAEVGVVGIDPDLADTAALAAAYDLPLTTGVNCVVVVGRREGVERVAACCVPASTRADVNGLVKRTLDVRKASFLPHERAVVESGMEHGGITPVGLPAAWRVLVDPAVAAVDVVVLGSGVRRSKLLVPGRVLVPLLEALGAEAVPGLGVPAP